MADLRSNLSEASNSTDSTPLSNRDDDDSSYMESEVVSLTSVEIPTKEGDDLSLAAIAREFSRIHALSQSFNLIEEPLTLEGDLERIQTQKRKLEANLSFIERSIVSSEKRLGAIQADDNDLKLAADIASTAKEGRHQRYLAAVPLTTITEDARKTLRKFSDSYKKNMTERVEIYEKMVYLKKQRGSIETRLWYLSKGIELITEGLENFRRFRQLSFTTLPTTTTTTGNSSAIDTTVAAETHENKRISEDDSTQRKPRFVSPYKAESKKRKYHDALGFSKEGSDSMDIEDGYEGDCDQSATKRIKRTDHLLLTPTEEAGIDNHYI